MTLYSAVLWFYAGIASLVFGASLYETLVVHPAWSRKPPESLRGFVGTPPVSQMHIREFWIPVAPLYALSALAASGLAYSAGSEGVALIVSTACAVAVVAWTLLYFRPAIERFLAGGGSTATEGLHIEADRWIRLNWIREALIAISWWGVLSAMATQG